MKHREVVTCPSHSVGWLGLGSPPPLDPSRVQDEICLFYPSFPGFPSPLSGPSPLLRLVLSLLESSRPPGLPVGSWYYRGQLRKSRRWRQAAQAADVRDARPGPERARLDASNLGFSCLWLVICLSITPGQSRQRGKALGALEPSFPSAWGTSQHFKCQSHFKLISLCIMFFKSFLNKTKIQSMLFPPEYGNKNQVLGVA